MFSLNPTLVPSSLTMGLRFWWIGLPGHPSSVYRLYNLADPIVRDNKPYDFVLDTNSTTGSVFTNAVTRNGIWGLCPNHMQYWQYVTRINVAPDPEFTYLATVLPTDTYWAKTIIGWGAAGYPQFRIHTDKLQFVSQTSFVVATGNATLQSGLTYQLAMAYGGGYSPRYAFYINGRLDAEGSTSYTPSTSPMQMVIGGRNLATEQFSGPIGEIRIYSRMLSTGEIQAIYDDFVKGYPATLRAVAGRSGSRFQLGGGSGNRRRRVIGSTY